MPKLPIPIDLTQDTRFNRKRAFTVGVFSDLLEMEDKRRSKILDKSLTKSQQDEFYKSLEKHGQDKPSLSTTTDDFTDSKELAELFARVSRKDNHLYPLYSEQRPKRTKPSRKRFAQYSASYQVGAQALIIHGESIVLSSAAKRAVVCEVVFTHKAQFKTLMPYELILHEYSTILQAYGITEDQQLRTAKADINKQVRKIVDKDIFIGRGGIQRNPIFRFNR